MLRWLFLALRGAEPRALLGLLMLATGMCAVAAIAFDRADLSGDEAHYWDWSRDLDWCYYSKPPLVAYVLRLSSLVSGGGESAIFTAGAMIFILLLLPAAYCSGSGIAQSKMAGLVTALGVFGMYYQACSVLTVETNKLVSIFWLGAMLTFHQAVNGGRGAWIMTGLFAGLGLLSKHTMVLLILSFALYLILVDRKPLKTRGPYLAAALAILMNVGVIYWYLRYGFTAYHHMATLNAGAPGISLVMRPAQFLLMQFVSVSPVLFPLFMGAVALMLFRWRSDKTAAYLFLCWGVTFGFFAGLSMTRDIYVHWPMQGYYAAAVALGYATANARSIRARRVVYGLTALHAVAVWGILCLGSFQTTPNVEGSRIGHALEPFADEILQEQVFLVADDRCLTALASFYGPGQPRAYCLPVIYRDICQYDIWGGWETLIGKDAILMLVADDDQANQVAKDLVKFRVFAACGPLQGRFTPEGLFDPILEDSDQPAETIDEWALFDDSLFCGPVANTHMPDWLSHLDRNVRIYKMHKFAGFNNWRDSDFYGGQDQIFSPPDNGGASRCLH